MSHINKATFYGLPLETRIARLERDMREGTLMVTPQEARRQLKELKAQRSGPVGPSRMQRVRNILLAPFAIAILVAACAAPPAVTPPVVQPTPQVIVKTVPGPTVTVEVTSQVCVDAITRMARIIDVDTALIGEFLDDTASDTSPAGLDYLGLDYDAALAAAELCLAGTEIGS